jgi:predicted N-acyltransferase
VVFLEEYFSVFKENLYILLILDAKKKKKKKKERKTQGINGLHIQKISIKELDNPTCCRIILKT